MKVGGQGDPDTVIVVDSGYDTARLAFALADLLVEVVGRLRSDRVFYRAARPGHPAPKAGWQPKNGRAPIRRPHDLA